MGELASEASLRGRMQLQIWENAEIVAGYPLSHDYHPPTNRVTPNGVGQLPESQTRHSQRVQPALSVTAFSRASSPIGRAKGRALPAQRPEISAPKSPPRNPYPHTRRSVSVSTFTFSSVVAQLVQKRMAR